MLLRRLQPILTIAAILFFSTLVVVHRVQAATLTVNVTSDVNDGACTVDNCSLREAIIAANAAPGSTVEIPPGTYILSIAGTQEDAAATGDLDITANMTIQGVDPSTTIIDANQIDRVFDAFASNITISDIAIKNGKSETNADGGGIRVAGTTNLIILGSVISNNTARWGGGIDNNTTTGHVSISGGAIAGNSAQTSGGINNFGVLEITDTTLSGNTAQWAAGLYSGAGDSVTILRSTISANVATNDGAGITNDDGGVLAIANSTISGNIASGNGGGINNLGTLHLTQNTLTSNNAVVGGGIRTAIGTVTSFGNILSNNSGGNCSRVSGSLTSSGYNFSSDGTCNSYFSAPTDKNNTNSVLGPLQNNGGYTFTHALQPGSPAIDAIPSGNCTLATDQRGITRPQGSACDSGAFEAEPGTLQTGPTFTVNVANDNNGTCTTLDCSLREAITAANANSDTNTITFSIPGIGLHTIQPATPLPWITNPVIIDATTQPGYAVGAPVIELNGTNAVSSFPSPHIDLVGINMVGASNSTVRGLIVNGWNYGGVGILGGSNNIIEGNFIGTNAAGTTAVPNLYGVIIYNGSNNRVGGTNPAQRNVIAGNNDDGVNIGGATNPQAVANIVQGNYIGTNATGTTALGNGDDGVKVEIADGTIIGGTTAASRNIIAASVHNGVILKGVDTVNSLVQGNYIGTSVSGTTSLGNGQAGVRIEGAINNTIGGTVAGARNIISGNNLYGVFVDSAATGNSIEGNYVGTDVTGTIALTPQSAGVTLSGSNNHLGGTILGARNIISGNVVGLGILGSGNLVQGNYIGTDVTGTQDIGNTAWGIELVVTAANNTIGGTVAGAGNVIAYNGSNGVVLHGATVGTGNAILGNSIYSNGILGIDLSTNPVSGGVTPNDPNDPDTGPNNLQNFPILTATNLLTSGTAITGTLNSEANKTYRLEFFANVVCDSSGNGEGQTYLGFKNVTTNGSGDATFVANLTAVVPLGQFITATATDPNNNTSEFSACAPVIAVSLPAAAPTPNYYRTTSVPLTWTGVTWATGYEIQVDDNADFMTLAYSGSLGANVRSDTANLPPVDAVYYWRVGAKKAGGGIVWSAPQKFTVDVP
jgi:CSLREA domain-containing protein